MNSSMLGAASVHASVGLASRPRTTAHAMPAVAQKQGEYRKGILGLNFNKGQAAGWTAIAALSAAAVIFRAWRRATHRCFSRAHPRLPAQGLWRRLPLRAAR